MKHAVALFAALALNAAANLLMKVGMKEVAAHGGLFRSGVTGAGLSIASSPSLVVGLACFALNAVFYMYALQSPALKISLAYPIMVGGGFAIIALVARVHPGLSERLSPAQWVGVALVLTGILLIAGRMNEGGSATT